MPSAIGAHDLGADHSERLVGLFVDPLVTRRAVEGRPPATGVVLRLRAEELSAAARAAVRAGLEHVVVFARSNSGFGIAGSLTKVFGDVGFDRGSSPTSNAFAVTGLSDTANATLIFEKY